MSFGKEQCHVAKIIKKEIILENSSAAQVGSASNSQGIPRSDVGSASNSQGIPRSEVFESKVGITVKTEKIDRYGEVCKQSQGNTAIEFSNRPLAGNKSSADLESSDCKIIQGPSKKPVPVIYILDDEESSEDIVIVEEIVRNVPLCVTNGKADDFVDQVQISEEYANAVPMDQASSNDLPMGQASSNDLPMGQASSNDLSMGQASSKGQASSNDLSKGQASSNDLSKGQASSNDLTKGQASSNDLPKAQASSNAQSNVHPKNEDADYNAILDQCSAIIEYYLKSPEQSDVFTFSKMMDMIALNITEEDRLELLRIVATRKDFGAGSKN